MYYGNPNATSASDGAATFDFFDDFDGPNLDESVWSATAPVSFQPDYLQMQSGAIYTDDFVLHDTGRIEAKIRWLDIGSALVLARQQGVQVNLGTLQMRLITAGFLNFIFEVNAYGMGMEYLTDVNIGPGNLDTWQYVGMAIINNQVIFFRDRDSSSTFNLDFPGDFFMILGHPSGADAGQMPIAEIHVDFLLRRSYAAVEPDYMVGVEENL
jgi:hypothetical protein